MVRSVSVFVSTMPMPSDARSGGGNFDSSVPGGEIGEPLRAIYSSLPPGATRMPRGRLPSGRVATAVFVAGSIRVRSPEISFVTYTPYSPCKAGGVLGGGVPSGCWPPPQAAADATAIESTTRVEVARMITPHPGDACFCNRLQAAV